MKNVGIGLLIAVSVYLGWQVLRQVNNEPSGNTEQIDNATDELQKEMDKVRKERESQSP